MPLASCEHPIPSLRKWLRESLDTNTAEFPLFLADVHMRRRGGERIESTAESILTLKNRESIHFGFLLRGFVEKESIHDT